MPSSLSRRRRPARFFAFQAWISACVMGRWMSPGSCISASWRLGSARFADAWFAGGLVKNLETRILKAEERSASDRRVGGTEDEGMILLLVEREGFSLLAFLSSACVS